MANSMLGFPNRIDTSSVSGGSWLAALPLANLKDPRLARVARSANLLPSSTQFDVDLGKERNTRIFAAINHNFSVTATYRLRGSLVADFSTTVFDSGATMQDVWPAVYPYGALEWIDDNWWSGKYTAEQIAGYRPMLNVILPASRLVRYWRLEISDLANPAGYVQLGRVFVGPAWQPVINKVYGASVAWETTTEVQAARSGAEYFDPRIPYRAEKFSLDFMAEDEAFGQAFEIQRQAGIHSEILYVHDPTDTVHAIRRQYLARLRQLSAIEYPNFGINKTAFELKELT